MTLCEGWQKVDRSVRQAISQSTGKVSLSLQVLCFMFPFSVPFICRAACPRQSLLLCLRVEEMDCGHSLQVLGSSASIFLCLRSPFPHLSLHSGLPPLDSSHSPTAGMLMKKCSYHSTLFSPSVLLTLRVSFVATGFVNILSLFAFHYY